MAEEIDEIDAALVETIASVEMIEEEIGEKEEQIEETSRECEEAMAVEQQQYEAMKLRIKFMYEKGDSTYLEILLSGKSFSDIINKVEYVERLYEYDRNMLERYQEAREAVEALKARLEEERAELEAQQHELEEEKESLEIILDEKQAQYDNYEVLLAQARQEAAVYKANIKKQNEAIRKLESEAADKPRHRKSSHRLTRQRDWRRKPGKPRSWRCKGRRRWRRPRERLPKTIRRIPAQTVRRILRLLPQEAHSQIPAAAPPRDMLPRPAIPAPGERGSRLRTTPASLSGILMCREEPA